VLAPWPLEMPMCQCLSTSWHLKRLAFRKASLSTSWLSKGQLVDKLAFRKRQLACRQVDLFERPGRTKGQLADKLAFSKGQTSWTFESPAWQQAGLFKRPDKLTTSWPFERPACRQAGLFERPNKLAVQRQARSTQNTCGTLYTRSSMQHSTL